MGILHANVHSNTVILQVEMTQMPSNGLDKQNVVHIMLLGIKRNKVRMCTTIWMNLKTLIQNKGRSHLSERLRKEMYTEKSRLVVLWSRR
jgi:hypothetical protein